METQSPGEVAEAIKTGNVSVVFPKHEHILSGSTPFVQKHRVIACAVVLWWGKAL
eukprot:COSAG02_NODE_64166_length_261_cov_0.641975_1_plen_54_part_01